MSTRDIRQAPRPNMSIIAGDTDCECCTVIETCCPDGLCEALCFCISNLAISFTPAPPPATVYAGPFCLPVYFDSYFYVYESQALTVDYGGGSVLQLTMFAQWVCTAPAGTPSRDLYANYIVEYIDPFGTYTLAENFGGTLVASTAACDDPESHEVAGAIDAFVTSGTGLYDVDGDYSITFGACSDPGEGCNGDPCAPYGGFFSCCNDGIGWFCGDGVHGTNDEMPLELFMTVTTSVHADLPLAYVHHLGLYGAAQNGIKVAYLTLPSISSASKFEFFLKCDGTVYQNVMVASGQGPPGTPRYIKQWAAVGSITTYTSCAPVQVTVTLTAGPYAGTVFEVTE